MKILITFFSYLGVQNDYLYPKDEHDTFNYPFKKAHWYKTRIGITTAWGIAKAIHG